jgi:hypothetical protein
MIIFGLVRIEGKKIWVSNPEEKYWLSECINDRFIPKDEIDFGFVLVLTYEIY